MASLRQIAATDACDDVAEAVDMQDTPGQRPIGLADRRERLNGLDAAHWRAQPLQRQPQADLRRYRREDVPPVKGLANRLAEELSVAQLNRRYPLRQRHLARLRPLPQRAGEDAVVRADEERGCRLDRQGPPFRADAWIDDRQVYGTGRKVRRRQREQ